jgi:hypothetical protein
MQGFPNDLAQMQGVRTDLPNMQGSFLVDDKGDILMDEKG